MKTEPISKKQKSVLYLFFLVGLVIMFAIYIPYLMDYYIIRPKESLFSFLDTNILNVTYHFEGIFVGIAIVILYCITMNIGVSTLVVSIVLFILTHASYTKYQNRRELLRLDDLRLTEAAGMAARYIHFELNGYLALLLGIFIFFTVAGFAVELFRKSGRGKAEAAARKIEAEVTTTVEDTTTADGMFVSDITDGERVSYRWKKMLILGVRFTAAALLCAVLAAYTGYFLKSRYVIDVIGPLIPENNMYVLYRFLQNDSLSTISMENVQESYDFLLSQEAPKETESGGVRPNVIVIMNESWWNTDNIDLDNISFSQDPMGPFKELSDCCTTGYLTTNVYGGGTVSPEMEFLTGLNTKYYLADSAYAQTLGHKLPSLADYFNGLDYETVAIHPYYSWFYSRDAVYESMGFDKVIFEDDMLYKDIFTKFISDESLAKQIINQAKEGDGGSKFIWAVSMGNHIRVLDYGPVPEDYEYPITVELKGKELSEEDYDTLVNYVNGIYLANQAFVQLVEYFSGVEEPTVLLMFGDHSPYFSTETLEVFGINEKDESLETLERMYSTPVIMWNNFSEEELSFTGESMYYLPQILIDFAGLPDSDMTRILRYERSYFKTNSKKIVRDAAGEELWQCTMEQIQALSHYKAVEYDILWGEGICGEVWTPITEGTR